MSDKWFNIGLTFFVLIFIAVLIWAATEPGREQKICEAAGGKTVNTSGAFLLVESGEWTASKFKSNDRQACVFKKAK